MRDKPLIDEDFRVERGPLKSDESYGVVGAFVIPTKSISTLDKNKPLNQHGHHIQCISHDGRETGWEHVSCTITHQPSHKTYCPNWEQMATIKQAFWEKEETVLQYHPKASEYVNIHKEVLHLFRPLNQEVPTPPTELLGPTNLG